MLGVIRVFILSPRYEAHPKLNIKLWLEFERCNFIVAVQHYNNYITDTIPRIVFIKKKIYISDLKILFMIELIDVI